MKILHLDLKTVQGDYVEFRYFLDNPNNYNSPRRLSLTEIADLILQAAPTNTKPRRAVRWQAAPRL